MPLKKTYASKSIEQILEDELKRLCKISSNKRCTVSMGIEISKVQQGLNHISERLNGRVA